MALQGSSISTRKLDLLYMAFFLIHIPIMLSGFSSFLRGPLSRTFFYAWIFTDNLASYSGRPCATLSSCSCAKVLSQFAYVVYQQVPRPILHQSSKLVLCL